MEKKPKRHETRVELITAGPDEAHRVEKELREALDAKMTLIKSQGGKLKGIEMNSVPMTFADRGQQSSGLYTHAVLTYEVWAGGGESVRLDTEHFKDYLEAAAALSAEVHTHSEWRSYYDAAHERTNGFSGIWAAVATWARPFEDAYREDPLRDDIDWNEAVMNLASLIVAGRLTTFDEKSQEHAVAISDAIEKAKG